MGLLNKVKRVEFDDGTEYVDIRKMSVGQIREMRQKTSDMPAEPGEEQAETQGYELARMALEAAIVAWSDEAEVNPENIAQLPYDIHMQLASEIGLGGGKDEDEDVPLPEAGDSASTDSSAESVEA